MPTFNAVQEDLVTLLSAAGLSWCGSSLTSGTTLFAGHQKPASDRFPEACVFVLEYGGAAPAGYLGGRGGVASPSIQVLGRCGFEQEADGAVGMRAILAALHQLDVRASGYVGCYVDQAAPAPWGLGDDDLYRWTVNVRLPYSL